VTDSRAERISEFIKLLRVTPGSEVTLARNFDPAFKAGFLNKKAGKSLHRQSGELDGRQGNCREQPRETR
jgi:hypothetical protein